MHIHYFEHKETFDHVIKILGKRLPLYLIFGEMFQVVTLKTKKTKEVELLKIRNPWNKKGNKTYETEWQGDWSDKSKLWKHMQLTILGKLPPRKEHKKVHLSGAEESIWKNVKT